MMAIFLLVISIYLIINVAKKPENGMIAALSIISFGPLFDGYLSGSYKFILIFAIFAIELFHSVYYHNNILYWCILVAAAIFKESIAFLIGINSLNSLFLSLYVYVIIFSISFFSYKQICEKNVDFSRQLKFYMMACIFVQLYRTFVDYSFGGIIKLEVQDEAYAYAYQMGEHLFRPSNLETPIAYAIEAALFFGLVLFNSECLKKKLPWLILAIVSVALTNSRSGMVMVALEIIAYCVLMKKIKFGSFVGIIGAIIIMVFDYSSRFFSVFNFETRSYNTRFNSISNALEQISNFSLADMLWGLGYGTANYISPDKSVTFYVEDFFLCLIANSGYITFLLFIIFIAVACIVGFNKKNTNVIMLVCLLYANIFACSLLIYSIQILFWFLSFSLLSEQNNKYANVRLLEKNT